MNRRERNDLINLTTNPAWDRFKRRLAEIGLGQHRKLQQAAATAELPELRHLAGILQGLALVDRQILACEEDARAPADE